MTAGDELRVLLVSPLGRDAQLIKDALAQTGIQSEACRDLACAIDAFRSQNVGALLIAEEALGREAVPSLATALAEQPTWSELPILVLTMGKIQSPKSGSESSICRSARSL